MNALFQSEADNGDAVKRLYSVIARLRAPDGCPWDSVQTLDTLKPCLIEECYELLDSMADEKKAEHLEELGDVLLQVLFQCQIREDKGDFSLSDVANAICEKLIRRHPHVFGDVKVSGTSDVFKNWEQIKKREKSNSDGTPRSAIAGVPASLPSLLRTQRVQTKASRVGYAWNSSTGVKDKVTEELAALDDAVKSNDQKKISDHFGNLFFSLVDVCRVLGVDAETALKEHTDRFSDDFRFVEKSINESGREMRDCTIQDFKKILSGKKE